MFVPLYVLVPMALLATIGAAGIAVIGLGVMADEKQPRRPRLPF